MDIPVVVDKETRKEYTKPIIVYEAKLETRAGSSPLSPVPDPGRFFLP